MKRLLLILLLTVSITGFCQSGLSYPYYLTSQNDQFYLKSIPYASQMYNIPGRTDIFKSSDSSFVYSVPRYFDPNGIVLSNDGNAILYTRYLIYNKDDFDEEVILYYQKGEIQKSYYLNQLIQKNLDDYRYPLFYRHRDAFEWKDGEKVFADSIALYKRKLLESPLFTNGSIAYLATKDYELLQFDLSNGDLVSRKSLAASLKVVENNFNLMKLKKPEFISPGAFHMPKLANGEEYQESIEKEFAYTYDGIVGNDNFKYYHLKLTCLIDQYGHCLEAYADFEDSTLNSTIENFFLNQTFDSNAVPNITERWYFSHSASFRNTDSSKAVNERIEERREEWKHEFWRNRQDTLDGAYIPKDIEDCFSELDNILTKNNREEFRKKMPSVYHMGLGRELRNLWGLWTSSRLKEHFLDLGITHPEDMSAIILASYKNYLNGREFDLDKQLSGYRLTPRPQLILPKDYKPNEK